MKSILYKLYILLILPVFVVITILCAATAASTCLLGAERFGSLYPGMIWSRVTLWLLLCPVEVKGLDQIRKGQPYVVTPNHTSALDIFLMYGYYGQPFKWVMKGSIRNIPVVGWACEKCGFIFVDQTSTKGALDVVRASERAIQRDYSVFMFPEGSRTMDGSMRRLKRGAFRVAIDTDTPVLPAVIQGGYEALSRDAIWPSPHPLRLTFCPEVDVRPYPKSTEGVNQLCSDVEQVLRGQLELGPETRV